jgi:hypothetical protein
VPGISYLLLGGLFLLSALCILFIEDTNNKALQGSIDIRIKDPKTPEEYTETNIEDKKHFNMKKESDTRL